MTTQPELPIDSIIVGERHRKDPGDIKGLAQSIDDIGLIHPVVVKPDNTLVAGARRLLALRELGWDSVPVTFIHTLNGAIDELRAERDENECRKDMSVSEKAVLGAALEELEEPEARERQRGAGGDRKSARYHQNRSGSTDPQRSPVRVRDKVGEGLGVSGRTYERIKDLHRTATGQTDDSPEVVEVAKDQLEQADKGETTIRGAHDLVQDARKGDDGSPPEYKGRYHAKQQIRTLEAVRAQLSSIASALPFVFEGGFEKTCTPAIAAEYARLFRGDLKEINNVVSRLEQHGKEKQCSVA